MPLAVITVLAMLQIHPGSAAAAPADRPAAAWPAGGSTTVTLLTGDRVVLGGGQGIQFLPGSGRQPSFQTWQSGSDVYVVPSDVARLVPTVLDPLLFNVSALVEAGLDDARSPALPLLVQHEPGASALAAGPLRTTRELHSISATAATLDKRQAGGLGATLSAGAARAAKSGASGALAGARHIWLDAPTRPALDPNLSQIGAPAAWNGGLSGSGVRVAVLDTGIDANHPDLAGQVVAAADFTGSPDTADRIGHGTHVAGIVAGTGVQSGNERKGVAFGARLLNGKVLGDNGTGTVSAAIAGMEWAVQQQADVVNMSIGVDVPSDGTDPWSQAVNALTQSSGTLFVVAAGNTGPGPVEIGAPGAADDALTVGAVDGNNQPAVFSSPGPRYGDRALKPEISGPGVDIISTRAAGTQLGIPVDDRYTRASGTSMASPHVAGAAAILVQQHPDWTPGQLKSALVGTAQPNPGVSGYVQGGGRVDLAHLVAQRVFANVSTVDFKSVAASAPATTRTVTLRNTGTAAVTVNTALSVRTASGAAAPAGLFAVSPASLSLPAGGTGTVTVTLTPSAAATGEYTGGLTLTPSSGRALRLPVGAFVTPPTVTVQVRGIDRDGNPARNGLFLFWNVDNAVFSPAPNPMVPGGVFLDANGEATVDLVAGRYSTMSIIDTPDAVSSVSLVGAQETLINTSTTLVLDARTTVLASPVVEGLANPTVPSYLAGYTRTDRFGRNTQVEVGRPGSVPLYVQPTPPVTAGSVESRLFWRVDGNDADGPAEVVLPFVETGFRNPPTYRVTAAEWAGYAQVEAEYRAFGNAQLDYGVGQGISTPLRGTPILIGSTGLQFPLSRTEYFRTDARLTWQQCVIAFVPFGPPLDQHCDVNRSARPAGQRTTTRWLSAPLDPTIGITRTADQLNFVHVSPLGDGDAHGHATFPVIGVRQQAMQIYRDGVLLHDGPPPPAFWVPTDRPATIRIDRVMDLDPNAVPLPSSTRVSWSFITRPLTGIAPVTPPVFVADVRMPGLDARNLAAAGVPLAVEVNAHTIPGATASPVSFVELFASSDDGQTWSWVTLTRGSDGIYRGQIPAGQVIAGGTLGIRVRAGDSQGGTVEQTQLTAVRVVT